LTSLLSATSLATSSATPSANPSNTSVPQPPQPQPQPDGNQASSSSNSRDLALGFGLTTAFLVTGSILVGFFARQTAFTAYTWIKNKLAHKRSKGKYNRHYQKSGNTTVKVRNPIESNVIHLNMNPAMIHQQTTLDILNLARQQRLEAIQAQQQQVTQQDDQTLSRIKSFKKVYQPIKAPGSSV
jgi:hypothetical protein